MRRGRMVWLSAMVALSACGGEDQPSVEEIFSGDFDHLRIEVDYEAGAEPFVDEAGALVDVWRIFGDNTSRLIRETGLTLEYPNRLEDMQGIGALPETGFDVDVILDLADEHRSEPRNDREATFYVLFLDGYLVEDGQLIDNVLGASLGDTGIIAMFKPVIRRSGSQVPIPSLGKFVEQSTLTHEFGHALGLVNRGVPLTSAHHDAENGAHCTNDQCVMHYLNEAFEDLRAFAQSFLMTGDTIIFGQECLNDTDAFGRR